MLSKRARGQRRRDWLGLTNRLHDYRLLSLEWSIAST